MNRATPFDHAIVKPETVAEMVAKYNQQITDLETLRPAYLKCKDFLVGGSYRGCDLIDFDATKNALQKTAWADVIDKTGLFSLMSIKAAEKIKDGLYYKESTTCEDLGIPAFTVENILDFIEDRRQAIPAMLDDKILEVYKILRPSNYYQLKTNKTSLFEGIGKKVILSCFFEHRYTGGIRIRFQKREEINALQEVFTLLDGRGTPKDDQKLYYKLEGAERADAYQDEYFKIKGYSNGNAHIEFKRLDLVEKIVATAKEKLLGAVAV